MYWSRRNVFWRVKINYAHLRSYVYFIKVVLKLLGCTLYENIQNTVTYESKLSIYSKSMQLTNCTLNATKSSSEVCKGTISQYILWILPATSNHHTTKIKWITKYLTHTENLIQVRSWPSAYLSTMSEWQ
jgi:hypothetical protein